jgi:hypothetical protein
VYTIVQPRTDGKIPVASAAIRATLPISQSYISALPISIGALDGVSGEYPTNIDAGNSVRDFGVNAYASGFALLMRRQRGDRVLVAQRRHLQFASLLLSFCLTILVVTVGGSEFFSIARSSFKNPVCCIDRTRNPFQPLR